MKHRFYFPLTLKGKIAMSLTGADLFTFFFNFNQINPKITMGFSLNQQTTLKPTSPINSHLQFDSVIIILVFW